jgi:Flp pilus assembly protein TadD
MRADALIAAGRWEEGLAMEAVLFADDPPLFHIHACLGMIRLVAGDRAGAAARFRRSLELRPDFGLARDGLRVALEGG